MPCPEVVDIEENVEIPHSVQELMSVFTQSSRPGISLEEENVLTYIAGYVAKKLSSKVCQECTSQLKGKIEGTENEVFISNKRYEGTKGEGLIFPSKELVQIVERLELAYKQNVEQMLHMEKLGSRILTLLSKTMAPYSVTCPNNSCPLGRYMF